MTRFALLLSTLLASCFSLTAHATDFTRIDDHLSLTTFGRRELRNQMKQCSADLRARLELAAQQSGPGQPPIPAYSRPELRILSW